MPIWRVQKWYIFWTNFNNSTLSWYVTFKNLLLTIGFGYIFKIALFLYNFHESWSWLILLMLQIIHIFPMHFECLHIALVTRHVRSLLKRWTRHWQHGALQGAHVRETSLCVMYFAPWFVTNICSFCWCSKYVTFSLTFCAPVLQNALCVTYGAPRRSLPSRLWGGPLATWAAKPG